MKLHRYPTRLPSSSSSPSSSFCGAIFTAPLFSSTPSPIPTGSALIQLRFVLAFRSICFWFPLFNLVGRCFYCTLPFSLIVIRIPRKERSENERLFAEISMLNCVFEMLSSNVVQVSSTQSTMTELTPFQRGSGPWPVRICFLRLFSSVLWRFWHSRFPIIILVFICYKACIALNLQRSLSCCL